MKVIYSKFNTEKTPTLIIPIFSPLKSKMVGDNSRRKTGNWEGMGKNKERIRKNTKKRKKGRREEKK